MTLFFATLLLMLASCPLYAQPAIEWEKCLGGSGLDFGYCIANTSDGGFIVAGSTTSKDGDVSGTHNPSTGKADMWIVKLSNVGAIEWEKTFGGLNDDVAHCIIQTKDSGYAIAGWTKSTDGDVTGLHDTNYDFWVVKINSTGKLEWEKTFGGSRNDLAYSIVETSDSGFVVAGGTSSLDGDVKGYHVDSTNIYVQDIWIVKLDKEGILEWQKTYGGTSQEVAFSIVQTFDKGYIVAGYTESIDGDVTGLHAIPPHYFGVDFWILRLNDNGSLRWQKTYGGLGYDQPTSVIQSHDSGYVIAGYTNSYDGDIVYRDHSPGELWVIKINDTGKIVWKQGYGGNRESQGTSVVETLDSGFAVGGWVEEGIGANFLIEKLDRAGNLQWEKTLGGTKFDAAYSIVQTREGGYAMAGFTRSNDGDVTGYHGDTDVWVVKLLPFTNTVPSGSLLASEISLYPNPNNGIGKIKYALEKSSQVRIEVYDAIGRLVHVVSDEYERFGIHESSFDLSELPSGQYFFHLRSDGISAVRALYLEK
jgi:hypothetical protein